MKHISTYLKNLKFDKGLSQSLISKYLSNLRLISLIILGVVIFGSLSFLNLPRNLFPDIKIPMVIVTTVLPGANPADVESLVTIPIEDSINGLSKVKTVQSNSLESVSTMTVEFETGVDPEKAKSDVQSAIDSVSLPEDAQKPRAIKLDLQKTPIWTFNLIGNNDRASLIRFAKKLKQELIDLPNIDSVVVGGMDDQEIQIIVKPEAISTFNVNPQQLIGAVKTALNTFPAGNVKTDNSVFSLTVNPLIKQVDDIRLLKVNLNGQVVSLGDIADVLEKSKPDQYPQYISVNGKIKSTIGFNVFRVTSVNIDAADKDAQAKVNELLSKEGGNFEVKTVINYAHEIVDQFNELEKNLIETIILVAVVLFLFRGKTGFCSSSCNPFDVFNFIYCHELNRNNIKFPFRICASSFFGTIGR